MMKDEEGLAPRAAKDFTKKIGGKLLKGQIADMSTIPAPSYLHHYISQQTLHKNDLSFCSEIKKAANTADPVTRLKHLVKFFIAPNCINPTICGCRIPINPILGETIQREMADGTKFYAE